MSLRNQAKQKSKKSEGDEIQNADYLHWYNDEISRYRNLEWQISAYSIGISYAAISFATNSNTKCILNQPKMLALLLAFFVICFLFVEFHIHHKLNEFREKRDALLEGKDHRDKKGSFLGHEWFDRLYFAGFLVVPLIIALLIIVALWVAKINCTCM